MAKQSKKKSKSTVKYGILINAWPALLTLRKAVSAKYSWEFATALKQIEPYMQIWEEKRQQLVIQYGQPTPMGQMQVKEGTFQFKQFQAAIQQQFQEWGEKDIEVEFPPIQREDVQDHPEVTAEIIGQLDPIFHWLPETGMDIETIRQQLNGQQEQVEA